MVNNYESVGLIPADERSGACGGSDTTTLNKEDNAGDTKQSGHGGSLYWIAVLQRLIVSNGVVALAALLIGVVYLFIGGLSGGDATGSSSAAPDSDLLALAPQSPDPPLLLLRQPARFASEHGHLDVRLTIDAAALSFANGVSFVARTYNGAFPGPTLVVHPGDTLTVTLHNRLGPEAAPDAGGPLPPDTLRRPNTTAFHTHGFHVSPGGTADNVFRAVGPGEEATFVYDLPHDHPVGLFYYHPHFHGSSAYQAAYAMLGAIVVRDRTEEDAEDAAADGGDAEDLVMVVSDIEITTLSKTRKSLANDHDLMGDAMPLDLRNPSGDRTLKFLVVNGQQGSSIVAEPHKVYRLRVVNAVMDGYLRLSVVAADGGGTPPCRLAELAADGISHAAPRAPGVVPTGSRRDLLLQCAADAVVRSGPAAAPDAAAEFLGAGSAVATGELFRVVVKAEGGAVGRRKQNLRERRHGDGGVRAATAAFDAYRIAPGAATGPGRRYAPEPRGDLRAALVRPEDRHVVEYTQSGPASVRETRADGHVHPFLGFDGLLYADHPPLVVRRDAVTELTVVNEVCLDGSPAHESHPFHMHTNHFQVVGATRANATYAGDDDGPDFRVGDWRDTISVPAPGRVTVRFVPRVYAGDSLVHCHTLIHEDVGMMLKLKIV